MKVWKRISLLFVINYFLVQFEIVNWNFFDLGAASEWERNLTAAFFAMAGLFCLAVVDILEAIREIDKEKR